MTERIVFVEFETDQPDPPVSWFVNATVEQEAEIQKLLDDVCEDWQNAYVGLVTPEPFEAFITSFREEWVDDGEDA